MSKQKESDLENFYNYFMEQAINKAQIALQKGEFPVGCILVYKNEIIATGSRQGTSDNCFNETDHAEINALKKLTKIDPKIKRKKITIFCTMEPCLMCFGAILLHKINKIVFAYEDVMGGGTKCDLSSLPYLYRNQNLEITPGILRTKSLNLFKAFFSDPANNYWKGSLLEKYTLAQ